MDHIGSVAADAHVGREVECLEVGLSSLQPPPFSGSSSEPLLLEVDLVQSLLILECHLRPFMG